jgi:5'-3' exonuclease
MNTWMRSAGRAKSALEGSKEVALLSQKLSRIVTDLDMNLDLEQARIDRFQSKSS